MARAHERTWWLTGGPDRAYNLEGFSLRVVFWLCSRERDGKVRTAPSEGERWEEKKERGDVLVVCDTGEVMGLELDVNARRLIPPFSRVIEQRCRSWTGKVEC